MPTRARKPHLPEPAKLPFRNGHGGARLGAGRKPNGERAGAAHTPRPALPQDCPVHVTIKLREGLPKLRQAREHKLLLTMFAAAEQRAGRSGKRFRLTHFAILDDQLHLLAEAEDSVALARAMQGLLIRVAVGLNKLWQRRGTVFADRYQCRALVTERAVRNALDYILANSN